MPPKPTPDRSIVLTSTTGEKSTWRPREYIPPDEVWDTVAAARILNANTPRIQSPKEPNRKKKSQKWWQKMTKRRRMQVLETGMDAFPTHRPTLLERVSDFWRPAAASSPPRSFSPRLGFPTLVLKDKEKRKAGAAAAVVVTSSLPSKFYECRGCMSEDPNGNVSHDRDTCKLPPPSSAATSLLELRTRPSGGSLNPLAGPSMQRARLVHERATSLIAASELPSPAASSKAKITPKTRKERKNTVEKDKKKTGWGWLSCCTKSKTECDCDNQRQGNLGRMEGETLIKINSDDSLVNITFADSPILWPVLFSIADDDETTEIEHEHEHQHKNKIENTKTNNSRQLNMARRKIEVAKAGSAGSTSAPPAPAAAPVLTLSTPRPQSQDREPTLSLAQRLKAMKEKHGASSKSGGTIEDIWGGERRVQGPGGIMRGESEVENGFVEVEIPASNHKEPKTPSVVASGSRVRFLGAALQDAMNTELPKPTEEETARGHGGDSDASSVGGSFKTARSTQTLHQGPATNNAAPNKQPTFSLIPPSGRTRSAPLMPPASSAASTASNSMPTGQPVNKTSASSGANGTDCPRHSLPIHNKKPGKTSGMNESYFKVRSQDGTDTGYPALDSSATSSDFGFHPTIVMLPGSWPDDDSEWMDGKDEFEAVMREKPGTSKSVKKR